MIVLDTDVLVIDLRYLRDARYAVNRQFLDHARSQQFPLAVTSHTLLEIVGKYSFNVPQADIALLADLLPRRYGLQVVPDVRSFADYAGCTVAEVLAAIANRMALGDAVNAVQIAKYASAASCLLTWNAKHYQGKLAIPALTPGEWLQSNQPAP